MKLILLTLALLGSSVLGAEWLHLPAKQGTANGKKIVLVSGDEEYRTEETCPMLAKILSQKHGFDCTVLFAIHPEGGYIDPNYQKNIPGTEALASADLLIIGSRFRQLTDDQLAPFTAYLNAGKPVIGFRTATHAFTGAASTGDFKWAEFGLKILGEKWVNHHGKHKVEGTRSQVEAANGAEPVLNGVGEIFATSDVYGIANLDEKTAKVLLRGAVTESLDPASKAIAGEKNNPMMPLAWLYEYTAPDGKTKGKSFCTTLGASVDFADEDLRRLIVNAAYQLVGSPVPAKADVNYVDAFEPTFYGTNSGEHYKKLNRKPADYALGHSPATGLAPAQKKAANAKKEPAKKTTKGPPLDAHGERIRPDNSGDGGPHQPKVEPPAATTARAQNVAPPAKGERIVLIGNGLAERDVYYSRIETELHLRYPDQDLYLRNMGHVGDTPGFRPHPSRVSQWAFPGAEKFHPDKQIHRGKGFYATPDQWLTHLQADTIVAFFGYNESFDGPSKVANFEAELDAWVQHTLSKAYNGKAAPRLVLVSPIAYEDLSSSRDLPNGEKENANLILYSAAVESVAKKHNLTFIDLFSPTQALYAKTEQPLTTGGFIPNDEGYKQVADILATGLYGHQSHVSKADPALVHQAVKDKDWFWNNDYNLVNGVHVHGQRYNPFGPQNYPDEVQKSREMAALRDTLIHEVAAGKKTDLAVDDSKTHKLPEVPTNYQPSVKNGSTEYLYGDAAVKSLTVPEGYKVELFASEKEFPNLANPMQLSFDDKGRLWVATMPTYPHYKPGDALPDDKILIYEDTNGDGKADKETVFADKLHLPIGFEFAPEGVYVSQEPNLVLLRDANGDDKADSMEIILGGFDTHDTHHAISAYTADPSGAFILCEGVFLHSNVETPHGPVRCVDGGFFRYSPQRGLLERTAQLAIPNPWGAVFDSWGQDFFLHTSGTSMNWMLPVSVKPTFGSKTPSTPDLIPEAQKVRPTSGLEIVSSRHFPDEVQGDIILCNAIGFLGIKQHQIVDDGTGWKTTFRQDLLKSTDGNFRPVDLEFAPDGSLYVIDWHNVLVGHMQHNARDPLRDHVHGRVYRITYPGRPLVKPAQVEGAPLTTLLNNLKEPELRTRYRTRREIRSHPVTEVLPAVKAWVAALDKNDANYEHHVLEALWTTWGMNEADEMLLRQLLEAKDFHARAAAVRVLRYNHHRIADHAALLEKAAADEHGRVRLEAIVAASWIPDVVAAKKIVAIASSKPLDVWSENAAKTAADRLAGVAEIEKPEFAAVPVPAHLDAAAKKQFLEGQKIYHREGHCVTCHQANGKGLDPAFPSVEKSPWVQGDPNRLIKLAMYGLMGPLEVNGKKYDGQVPMTPFAGMLKDDEMAAVLTFVRNSFGNKADAIQPAQVKAIRDANAGRVQFYTTEELLKEHPMK
ncbi:putative membrane-bound dehydrogenase-like protein [Prosthecobacter fusiformis]|uniref:Putative membrane-bound dehydrogenase-like protein n=1 Tax=Prosthecobacter fusiformis TaxID=48464 RepID=A0A4R7SST3_9BACT|nr:PVC-type heme-binding CxxCH protein [Prosthecobacter fusiformis]TDU81845.1 putative membrane-bound dehydrogenase-like protein [Prosthecobacter fusiformis]